MDVIKLNLGCGEKGLPGFINLDKDAFDLEKFPYNIAKVDYIILENVLEHCNDRYDIINNLSKILNDNGKIEVHLPTFSPRLGHKSSIHSSCYFDELLFDMNDGNLQNKVLFNLVSKKYVYRRFKHILHTLFKLFQMIFVSEIEFVLEKK